MNRDMSSPKLSFGKRVLRLIAPFGPALVWLYALLLAVPLYYLVVTSFKDNTQIFNAPAAPPSSLNPDNYFQAFSFISLGRAMLNSAYITIGAEVLTLALALPAAYGLARARGKIVVILEQVFAAGFLIPAFAALVPTVILAIKLGLFYNPVFLILFFPATQLPLSVLLLTQFMRAIPGEIEESAMMDGASRWSILWLIYTPMIMPGLTTVAILNFLTFWNEYLFSLSILGLGTANRTVQVAVPQLISNEGTDYGVLAAAAIMSIVPVLLLYILAQKRLENALVAGSVKG